MSTTHTRADATDNANDKVVLLTGTSSGIGLATAVACASAGWKVIATMRDMSKATALRARAESVGVTVEIAPLDVTDAESVTGAIERAVATHGRLDAVINNAGSATVGTVENLTIEAFRSAMEVNFFGVVQVTKAALPHLRRSGGRVITVSSVGGAIGQPFNEAYCAAKFAVEGFLESLQPVAESVGVSVHVVEPGAVSSEFVTNARIDPTVMIAEAGAYAPALGAYLHRTAQQFDSSISQTPDEVAAIVTRTLEAVNPPFRAQTSEWSTQFVATKYGDLDGSKVTGMTAAWVAA